MEKLLEDAHIRLSTVATDLFGVSPQLAAGAEPATAVATSHQSADISHDRSLVPPSASMTFSLQLMHGASGVLPTAAVLFRRGELV